MRLRQLLTDEDGVSPVIGVILMVAITVILAAIIGTFVLGLGENIQTTAPTTSISISANDEAVVLSHTNGDGLAYSDTKIVVRDTNGAVEATFDEGSSDLNANLNGKSWDEGEEFTVGDSITLDGSGIKSGNTYEIQVIHKPSEATVASSKVVLN